MFSVLIYYPFKYRLLLHVMPGLTPKISNFVYTVCFGGLEYIAIISLQTVNLNGFCNQFGV